jgi:DNA repair exonuclease SbcCD ATPase subunit
MPPKNIKPIDPEMSAAGKIRAAKQPRQAGGKFASTTNAQEQRILDLEAQIAGLVEELNTEQQRLAVARETFDNIHALLQLPISASVVEAVRHLRGRADRALELEEKASEMNARAAQLEEAIRLLTEGNKQLIEDRDLLRGKFEHQLATNASQLDTIQGDRKQIAKLQVALGQVSELLHFRAPAPNESIDDWGSDLRDAYEEAMRADAAELYARDVAERDRLKAVVECQRAALDALRLRTLWQRIINAPVSHMDDCEVVK